MKVVLLDSPEACGGARYRGAFFTLAYRRVHCSHRIPQPGKDKSGRRRRARYCRNDATFMDWLDGNDWDNPRCTQHERATS